MHYFSDGYNNNVTWIISDYYYLTLIPFVPLGLYGIDLKQNPKAQVIGDAAGLDGILETFVGSM